MESDQPGHEQEATAEVVWAQLEPEKKQQVNRLLSHMIYKMIIARTELPLKEEHGETIATTGDPATSP